MLKETGKGTRGLCVWLLVAAGVYNRRLWLVTEASLGRADWGGLSGMVRRGRRQRHISRPRSLSLEASALGMRETTDPLDAHPLVCIERLLGSGDSDHSWFCKSVAPRAGCAGAGIQAAVCAEPLLSPSPHVPLNKPDSKESRQSGETGLVMSWGEGSGVETHSGIRHTPAGSCPLALNLELGRGLS